MEGASDVLLSGPALLDEMNHRVRLGHLIGQGILCQDNPGYQHHTMFILRPDQTALVDDVSAFGVLKMWKEVVSFGSAHNERRLSQRSKKRTGLGSHPAPSPSAKKGWEQREMLSSMSGVLESSARVDYPKSGRWNLTKEGKPQMDTDQHRFFRKKSCTFRVIAVSFPTPSYLCPSVSICGFNCFFRIIGLLDHW